MWEVVYNGVFVVGFVESGGSVTEWLGSGCTGRLGVKAEIPEAVEVACAFEHDRVVSFDGDAVFGEAHFVAVVTELSDG